MNEQMNTFCIELHNEDNQYTGGSVYVQGMSVWHTGYNHVIIDGMMILFSGFVVKRIQRVELNDNWIPKPL